MRRWILCGFLLFYQAPALQAFAAPAPDGVRLFSETLFSVLIYGALIGSATGCLTLVLLILQDRKKGKIW